MSFTKLMVGIRNNWKKSIFGTVAAGYIVNYGIEYYDTKKLMKKYCEKALKYGREPIKPSENPLTITVILNPNANKRKAIKDFEKYCAPILFLAGMCVDVVQTESEGHAKKLMEGLELSDAIIVAGGDGTLSEVVTGLLRKTKTEKADVPVGILPLGKSNTIGKSLFPGGNSLQKVRSLADASMAIIEKHTRPIDVMKIEAIDEDPTNEGKPVYAVSSIEWGAYRDARAKKDKYWFLGPLRSYATYLFNGYKNNLTWNCQANINYTLPCAGCKNCVTAIKEPSWFQRVIFRVKGNDEIKCVNNKCKEVYEKTISTPDLALLTMNTETNANGEMPKLKLDLGPNSIDYFDFVKQGWRTESGQGRKINESIEAKEIEIKPINFGDVEEQWFSIDKEDFEVKPVKITLLPKAIQIFCKRNSKQQLVL